MNLLKYITTSIAIVCLASILAGCGGSASTPEGAVKKQINAIKKWDMKALAEVSMGIEAEKIPATLGELESKMIVEHLTSIPGDTKKEIMAAASHVKIVTCKFTDSDGAVVVVSVPRGIPGEKGFDPRNVEEKNWNYVCAMENGASYAGRM